MLIVMIVMMLIGIVYYLNCGNEDHDNDGDLSRAIINQLTVLSIITLLSAILNTTRVSTYIVHVRYPIRRTTA